jgi:hypothetical protein
MLLLLLQATSGSRQEVVLAAGDSLFGEASRIAVAGKLSHFVLPQLHHGTQHCGSGPIAVVQSLCNVYAVQLQWLLFPAVYCIRAAEAAPQLWVPLVAGVQAH